MKILVTGSRVWKDPEFIEEYLVKILGPGEHTVVHGGATGVDSIAKRVAEEKGWSQKEYVADWKKYKKSAGPIRNREMLTHEPDIQLVVAFTNDLKKSRGTKDMITAAVEKGYPVLILTENLKKDTLV